MHVESVAWVTERKDVLFGLFYLLASLCYVMFSLTEKRIYFPLIYIFFVLSLLSKIQAVSLPLTLLLYDFLLKKPLKINLILEKVPLFMLSLVTGIAGLYFLRQQESLDSTNFTFFEGLLTACYSLIMYIVKSVIPYELLPIYPYPKSGQFGWYFYLMPLFLIVLIAIIIRYAKKNPALVFGSLFFLVNIVFVLQFVTAGQGFMADRFSYLPYIGLFYFYIKGIEHLYKKAGYIRFVVVILCITITTAYIYLSNKQAVVWNNSGTLFSHQLNSNHKVPTAYHNRANYFRNRAKELSDRHGPQLMKSTHDSIIMFQNKAIEDYSYLIKIKPFESKSYVSRGRLFFNLTDYNKAFSDFCKAIELDSLNKDAYSNRASIYGMRNQYDEALADLNKALFIDPFMKEALLNRSLLFFNASEFQKAINDLDKYLSMEFNNAGAIDLRGLCKFSIGQKEEALKDFEQAIILQPDNSEFLKHRDALKLKY